MKIDFVRHGKSEHNGKGFITGQMDISLTQGGIEQAEEAASKIEKNYTSIYSSDLLRCKQTAEIINKKLGLTIIYDRRLRERNCGSLEGQLWENIPDSADLKERDIKLGNYDYHPYGGESVGDVKNRVVDFLNEIIPKKENVLVVTHD